jgi:hypothetical protein
MAVTGASSTVGCIDRVVPRLRTREPCVRTFSVVRERGRSTWHYSRSSSAIADRSSAREERTCAASYSGSPVTSLSTFSLLVFNESRLWPVNRDKLTGYRRLKSKWALVISSANGGRHCNGPLGIFYLLAAFLWACMPAFRKLMAFFGPPVPVTLNFFPRCLL